VAEESQEVVATCENSSAMRRAVLLYNPRSGSRHERRNKVIELAAEALRAHGVEVQTEPTTSPQSAGTQARALIADGFDTIIACGGDGTVHDVLQGVANLGVIPVGTANSLAQDLGLSNDAARAAAQLVQAPAQRIAVGSIEFECKGKRESRYFTVAAGVGADAALFYKLNAGFKQRWGMAAYVAMSLRMWAFEVFHPFEVNWKRDPDGTMQNDIVTQLLIVRIENFGGVLNRLAPGAELVRNDFRLVLFKTGSKARYLRFALGRLFDRDWKDSKIELVHAVELTCAPLSGKDRRSPTLYAEADGELLGRLPVSIQLIPHALNLLIPRRK
jgi:diacylglycerol kinase (ATP)